MHLAPRIVDVAAFCIDQTEVTADAYAACVRAGRCDDAGLACGPAATYGVAGKGNHPINCVDWRQATSYCEAQDKRLPMEEEWEWEAQGRKVHQAYPWGEHEPRGKVCWSESPREGTCPVGSFPAGDGPGAVHDLAGNVREWTSSTVLGEHYVYRGGDWASSDYSDLLGSLSRWWEEPTHRNDHLGFRCATSLPRLTVVRPI